MTSPSTLNKVVLSLINFLGKTPAREKLCRFFQYFAKYLASRFQEINQAEPYRRNQLLSKIKKADTVWGAMSLARKILRFGPSINCVKTFILNSIELINGKNKQSTPIFTLKTLSALWIAMFYICDHYLWCFRMGIAKNESIRAKADYYCVIGWYLDCYTGLLKNLLIYLELVSVSGMKNDKEKKTQTLSLIIDSVRLLLDLPVAYSFLHPGTVSGKTVGACGAVTSVIGLYQLWE